MQVAIVGCGRIGRRRAQVVRDFPGTELVAVADIDIAKARQVAEECGGLVIASWEEVVTRRDVDVVVVSTVHKFLAPITVAALESGKHVLCEKPLGRTPHEARAMVEAAQRHGVRLKTGFNHRHHRAIHKAREMLDGGAIGEVNFIRCRYGHGGRPGYDREWRCDPDLAGGGEMLDQGIHAVDLFRWFLGDFTEATGFVSTRFWRIAPLEDNAFALFRTASGQVAQLHASWTQWKNVFSFEVFGQEGYLVVDGLGGSYGPERLTWGRRRPESGPPLEEVFEFPGLDDSWQEEWAEFMAALREDREPQANGYDGWQAMRMVYAVYESSRTGQVLRLSWS